MFGSRPDAKRVEGLPTVRRFMPFISPRRNDSLVLYTQEVEAEAALKFVEEYNRGREPDHCITLFHLVLRAIAKALHEYPGINRFVAGGRLWQRDGVWLTFAAKQEILPGSPLLTIKREFSEGEDLDGMVDSILGNIRSRRGGRRTTSDKEMSLASRLPPFVTMATVKLLMFVNRIGALPKKMIDDDPLFTSLFVANLGSVGLEAGYHHLWEYGTCSMFAVMGRLKPRHDGVTVFEMQYSYDERMEDGLYGGLAMSSIKEHIEKPEGLRD
ncbi:MAG: 2-oxo acid dehydrogenase subunit E2 [Myxococcota bacterium]|jgi:hypothetical protein